MYTRTPIFEDEFTKDTPSYLDQNESSLGSPFSLKRDNEAKYDLDHTYSFENEMSYRLSSPQKDMYDNENETSLDFFRGKLNKSPVHDIENLDNVSDNLDSLSMDSNENQVGNNDQCDELEQISVANGLDHIDIDMLIHNHQSPRV